MKIESVVWRQGVRTKGIDPVQAHKAIEEVRDRDGCVTDDSVVDAARPQESPIHNWFEWDDSSAAIEYRRQQARNLIGALEVRYEESDKTPVRVYQVQKKSTNKSNERTAYSTTEEVLSDPECRDRLIADAIRDAMAFRRKFRMLHELDQVMQSIDKAIETLSLEAVS